ncbi:MAG: ABC transporter ATP-binding protein [Anaerolineaceae bacterium]|jgi:ABC-type lipoprotein export system ATPase subunit
MSDIQANHPIIEARNLVRTYRIGAHQQVPALRGVDLSISAGCVAAVKGRSGSGKTTLLNCLGGLDRPDGGAVVIDGQDLSKLNDDQLTRFRRTKIGFVFQAFGLSATLSAYENVELMLRIAGAGYHRRRERAQQCLKLVGLERWMHHRPDELSGGQQQRVAIARAIANHPRLILADEPTGKLDTETAHDIMALFRRIVAEEGLTLLMASHDPLVDAYVDIILNLNEGRLHCLTTA